MEQWRRERVLKYTSSSGNSEVHEAAENRQGPTHVGWQFFIDEVPKMKANKLFLIVFALFALRALNVFAWQETDRDRTRDAWQRPQEVFDALALKPGHRVADVGCGSGYFTFRLAAQVGVEGKVFAVDIEQKAIEKVRLRKEREQLKQIEPILGESADPHLPNDLDSVLIVDSYHEFREYDRMMQAVFRAMRPGGRLVVIDGEAPIGRPRTEYHRLHTIPPDLVKEDLTRNGFAFKESQPGFYDAEYGKKMYFLVFEKPAANRILEYSDSHQRCEPESFNKN